MGGIDKGLECLSTWKVVSILEIFQSNRQRPLFFKLKENFRRVDPVRGIEKVPDLKDGETRNQPTGWTNIRKSPRHPTARP